MFFKEIKSLQSKSYSNSYNYSTSFLYDDTNGKVIGEPHKLPFSGELKQNLSISTLINKQLYIAAEGELVLYEDIQGKDKESTNKTALSLYDILLNPNCRPAPQDWDDVLEYALKQYNYYGIAALVLVFDGEFHPNNLKYLKPAYTVNYVSNLGANNDYYNILFKYQDYNQTYQFKYNEGFYTTEYGGNTMVAIILGNYDYDICEYASPWVHLQESILIQNYIINANRKFYENSCRPSSIITLSYKDDMDSISTQDDRNHLQKVIENFKTEIKGSVNTGKSIILNQPNMEVQVTPLNITTDAGDIEKQLEMTKNNIYSYVAGGSTTVVEGVTEYSNNALEKLREFYDGTLSYIDRTIINPLNTFLQLYLETFDPRATNRKDIYFTIERSQIEFYKKYTEERASMKYQNNEITLNEVRKINSELRELWADAIAVEGGDRLLAEIQKGNQIQ
jgi:hypothetical protein